LDGESKKAEETDQGRRKFLKTTVVASAVIAIGGVAAVAKSLLVPPSSAAPSGFPMVQLLDSNNNPITVTSLQVNTPFIFPYPLDDEPSLLVKLGVQAENGIGPDGDIVAFSDLCQHLGCQPGFVAAGQSPAVNPSYVAPGPEMYCPCHGSKYDLLEDAAVIQPSPAPRPVPRVILQLDDAGNIYAIGMTGPTIFGHGTPGSSDVSADLQGGNVV
jgi:arsenite oxidase small subunit